MKRSDESIHPCPTATVNGCNLANEVMKTRIYRHPKFKHIAE